MTVYYAGPTDAVEDARAVQKLRSEAGKALTERGEVVFFPQLAFAAGKNPNYPQGIQQVNDYVIRSADAVLVDLLTPARRVGTLIELGIAVGLGIPVVVIASPEYERHLALHQPGVTTFYAERDGDGVVDRAVAKVREQAEGRRTALSGLGTGQDRHLAPPHPASKPSRPLSAPAAPIADWLSDPPVLEWLREPGGDDFDLPARPYEGDAGFDLPISEDTTIPPGQFVDVPHAFRAAAPPGFWLRITGRSSTLRKYSLLVNESVIDEGWRGPLFAGVRNLGDSAVTLERGMRVAQVIPHALDAATLVSREVWRLRAGDRGEEGFGSTGS